MFPLALHPLPSDLEGLLVYIVGLIILWAIISVPVYFAGRAITKGNADFGDAMGATLGGGIAYFVVFYVVGFFLGAVIGPGAEIFAIILGALVWFAVFRAAFRTTWLGALAVVIIAYVILLVLDFILVAAFGVGFPNFFPT
jgi:hypothetical protein